MLGNISGRVAIVTGSGQGIGQGIAKVFAAAGARVVVATRSAGNGQETVDAIIDSGGEAILLQCDVGRRQEVEDMVANTVLNWGQVDIAVHNAGVYPLATIEDLSDEAMEHTLSVNTKSAVWITQACVPHFRKQGGGRLLFTSSVTGPRVAMPGMAHYAMSKGGLNGFIRTAALEYARENITVNGVEPGYILTQALASLGGEEEIKAMSQCIPKGHMGTPEDVAYAMLFLASDEASYITGQTIVVDGGSTLPESQVVMDEFYD
jgi:3-oxoacyl-[acyl-carrier protein] reductase